MNKVKEAQKLLKLKQQLLKQHQIIERIRKMEVINKEQGEVIEKQLAN